jgi:hypothetical protein
MIDGMDILLERMEMYPEEFVESRKWHDIIGRVIDVLEEDELTTLAAAARQAQRDWFKGAVLKTLAGNKDSSNYAEPETFYGNSLSDAIVRHQRHKNEAAAKDYLQPIPIGPLVNHGPKVSRP